MNDININVCVIGGVLADSPKKLSTAKGKNYAKFTLKQTQGFGDYTRDCCYECTFFFMVDDIMKLEKGDAVLITGSHEYRVWQGNPVNSIKGNNFTKLSSASVKEPEPEVTEEDWVSDAEIEEETKKNEESDEKIDF